MVLPVHQPQKSGDSWLPARKDVRVVTSTEARQRALRLAAVAVDGGPDDWAVEASFLESLDGRGWLLVDQAARTFHYAGGTPVSGVRGWLGTSLAEPTGFVASVTTLHIDGRFREQAVRVLGMIDTRVATMALSARLLDHVPQVRAAAWAGIRPRLGPRTAELVLDVLLAGRSRLQASEALASVQAELLLRQEPAELVHALTTSARRRVRRWAFNFGHEHDLLTVDELVHAARTDRDQYLRAVCADWLMAAPDPQAFGLLLDAKSVEARLVALTKVPDHDLSEQVLGDMLVDRAPRVREQARWRARRRGIDIASFYRQRLGDAAIPTRVRSASIDGLALVGDERDLAICVDHLSHPVGRVRASAVSAVLGRALPEVAVELVTPMLLDPSARVCSAAAKGLARLGVPAAVVESAWASPQSWSRRAAWILSRASGGWDRVEADLRAAGDDDSNLAGLGQAGIRNWLEVGAATTWQPLSDDQRQRIGNQLAGSGLTADQQRMVAFHAGVRPVVATQPARAEKAAAPAEPAEEARWRRFRFRRSRR